MHIRIDAEVAGRLVELAEPGESPNAVIRRRLKMPPNQKRRSTMIARHGTVSLAAIKAHPGLSLAAHDYIDEDVPHESGDDRYAIYAVVVDAPITTGALSETFVSRRRLAETSQAGIGLTLVTLREEGEITNDTRVGILDRVDRTWIVNPWARGL